MNRPKLTRKSNNSITLEVMGCIIGRELFRTIINVAKSQKIEIEAINLMQLNLLSDNRPHQVCLSLSLSLPSPRSILGKIGNSDGSRSLGTLAAYSVDSG